MNKNGLVFGLTLLLVGVLLGACNAAPTTATTEAPVEAPAEATATQAEAVPDTDPEPGVPYPYPAPAQAASSDPYPAPAGEGNTTAGFDGEVVYTVSQDETLVGFAVEEVLRGNPFTAQGTTNQVTGEITVNYDAATVQMGTIEIAANTLRTDSSMRDRAIAQFILQSSQYPTITFVPKSINGLPAAAEAGQEVTLQITGDLTIRDVTKEVTFETKVKLVSPDRLEGTSTATVLRSDFGLQIPSVPQVASVDDDVLVVLEFVAVR